MRTTLARERRKTERWLAENFRPWPAPKVALCMAVGADNWLLERLHGLRNHNHLRIMAKMGDGSALTHRAIHQEHCLIEYGGTCDCSPTIEPFPPEGAILPILSLLEAE